MSVVVYAATGWTGRLVVAALQRAGLSLAIAGRDQDKLRRLQANIPGGPPVRLAAVDDGRALRSAFAGARLVVNCVGPYREFGAPVLDAALDVDCHYLDVSGEESYLAEVHRAHGARARARGLTVCPGFAAKGALGDWGAVVATRALPGRGACDEVAVAYAHGLAEYFRPSAGSVLSAAGQGFFRSTGSVGGPAVDRTFAFPPPFGVGRGLLVPGAEDVSVPRHLQVHRVHSYLSLSPGSVANGVWADLCTRWLPAVPAISRILLSDAGRGRLATMLGSPRRSRDVDSFAVAVEARRGRDVVRLGMSTRDAYAVTAEIVALGATLLANARSAAVVGVVAPAQLYNAATALAALRRLGALRVLRLTEHA